MHVPETVLPQMEMAADMEQNDEFSSDELRSYTAYGLSHAAHHGGATLLGFRDQELENVEPTTRYTTV